MPDIGDRPHPGDKPIGPSTWAEAFAALPDETPEARGWERLQERLAGTGTPARRGGLRWAVAAALAIAAAMPFALRHRAPTAVHPVATTPAPSSSMALPSVPATAVTTADPVLPRTHAVPVAPAIQQQRQRRDIARATAPHAGSVNRSTDRDARGAELESLYAQSARLESLLALARDDQVGNGLTTVLSDDISARIAVIDAALAQSRLDEGRRAGLWRSRVEALRQLVGIEATDRLYSARGQSRDVALVTID